jgi:hypothetical protein
MIETFDRFGLDAGCNYQAQLSDVTIYLTRRSDSGLDAAMVEAKREFETARASEHPQPISGSPRAGEGLEWKVALYAADGGLREGIWVADMSGWTIEYRATYHAEDEKTLIADLGAFTDLARKTAGARLSLCAKSPAPHRAGQTIINKKQISEYAVMTSLLGSAALAGATGGSDGLEQPLIWCAEKPIEQSGYQMLFWRAVNPGGEDANSDQLTLMTDGPPPTLMLGPDGGGIGALINAVNNKTEKWTATMRTNGRVRIFAYFNGRPPPEIVSDLFTKILKGDAKAVGGYGVNGKNITIETPPDGK